MLYKNRLKRKVTTTGVLTVIYTAMHDASISQKGCIEDYADLQKRLTEVQAKEVFSGKRWAR